MRFLLSVILSSFLLIPFQGNAGGVRVKQITTVLEKNTSSTDLLDYSINDDYAGAIINVHHRNSLTTHHRVFPFDSFISTEAFHNPENFSYQAKLFVQPHLYCKRIGLKLIFPEHYFW